MLDNAKSFSRAAGACDLSRPMQRVRFDQMVELREQQLEKAARLKERLDNDASIRNGRVNSATWSRSQKYRASSRYRADVAASVPEWVCVNKERDRQRAATDARPRPRKDPNFSCSRKTIMKSAVPTEILTLEVDKSDDDEFLVTCILPSGRSVVEFAVPRNVRFGGLWCEVKKRRPGAFSLVLNNGVLLDRVKSDYLLKDAMDLTCDSMGYEHDDDDKEELSVVMPRNMARKPPSDTQRQRMNRNRNANKKVHKEALKCAKPKSMAKKGLGRDLAMPHQQRTAGTTTALIGAPLPKTVHSIPIGGGARSYRMAQVPIGANPNMFKHDK